MHGEINYLKQKRACQDIFNNIYNYLGVINCCGVIDSGSKTSYDSVIEKKNRGADFMSTPLLTLWFGSNHLINYSE